MRQKCIELECKAARESSKIFIPKLVIITEQLHNNHNYSHHVSVLKQFITMYLM